MATSDRTVRAHSGAPLLGLVVPTRWEAQEILRRFSFKKTGANLFKATIHDRPVLLCRSGVGRPAGAAAGNRLVSEGAKVLVSMGFCGALIPSLKVGDLVTDRISTVDKPVQTPDERLSLTQRTNAIAVDMETQAVIESGTRKGVPIHVLRVVSDEFEDDLRPLFGSDGSFSGWKIALRLLNPTVWPLAWKLKKNSQLAAARLADALDSFCESL